MKKIQKNTCKGTYIALHNHSHFSFLAGVPSPRELVARAAEYGYRALGLTDVNSMSGLILFLQECRRQSIQPVLGVELQNLDDSRDRLLLFARNKTGYAELCEILTLHLAMERPHRLVDVLKRWQGTEDSLVFVVPVAQTFRELLEYRHFTHLFAEIANLDEATRIESRACHELARQHQIPLVLQHPSWFLDQDDVGIHRVLRAIDLNTLIGRVPAEMQAPEKAFFCRPGFMEERYGEYGEWLKNSTRIVELCQDDLQQQPWILPPASRLPGEESPEDVLRREALQGLERNYKGTPHWGRAQKIQEKELDLIIRKGYAGYFLTVKKIRDYAGERFASARVQEERQGQKGYRHYKDASILRGSAANSLTLYNIGASDLDPVEHDLYFERFLNEDRASPPDADLDFAWDEREDVLQWMFREWGEDHTAMICTTCSFRWRSAFRETAKTFGYGDSEITRMLKELKRSSSSRKVDVSVVGRKDHKLQQVLDIARRIHGKPRYLGQHPGGVIITRQPVWRHVACQKTGGGRRVTQIDMHNGMDYLGLIKYDILGNGSLAVLRDALAMLHRQGKADPQLYKLQHCFDDPGVQSILRTGRTRGIFYIESPAQARLNQQARAETFSEIGITSSLVRPAGAAYTGEFVHRHRQFKSGEEADWEFLHPSLRSVLGETHDVLVFQEDILKICVETANMSFAQADRVRKMMNSLHEGMPEGYDETRRQFVQGCVKHSGFSTNQAEQLWKKVQSFQGFSFCKSHSLSYAQLSFKCAWLKVHYPAEFLGAVVRNMHGFYSVSAYLEEARRWGVAVLGPDINHSEYGTRGEDGKIRLGLQHILGLPRELAESLVREREHGGVFCSWENLLRRCDCGVEYTASLIRAGALDGLGEDRFALMLENRTRSIQHKQSRNQKNGKTYKGNANQENLDSVQSQQELLFEQEGRLVQPLRRKMTVEQKCAGEIAMLGFPVSMGLVEALRWHPVGNGACISATLQNHAGRRVRVFGSPMARRTHRVAATQKMMLFLTLQDYQGTVDVIFWPEAYDRWHHLTYDCVPMEIWGVVQEEKGTYSLIAERVALHEWSFSGASGLRPASRNTATDHNQVSGVKYGGF